MSILSLLQHSKTPTNLYNLPEGFYEGLVNALKTQSSTNVANHLAQIPRIEHFDPHIVGCFLAHFSKETMGLVFDKAIGTEAFFAILDATEVASEQVWTWLIDERQLPERYFLSQAVAKLKDGHLTEHQQQSLVNFFTALTSVDANSFLSEIVQTLKAPCVDNWASCVWEHLGKFTHQDWRDLLKTLDMDHLLYVNHHSSYTYLNKSLQYIPHCQEAFDQYFEDLNHEYLEFVKNFSSPKGLKHSLGFKQLPSDIRKRLHYEISQLYHPDNMLIAKYKHILGYTNDELFLKTFGFDNLEMECDIPMLNFLSNGLQPFHPLHIILQKPEGFLQFNSNATHLIAQHLDHPLILQNLFDDMEPQVFSRILEQHPQLVQWKDAKGNSLGHWCVVNIRFDEEWAEFFTQHPQLLEPNHNGFTLRNIVLIDIEIGNVEEDDLAVLDHILISNAVSNSTAASHRVRKI